MRILITGITGFVGSHLAEHCLFQGCEVFGLVRHRSSRKNIEHLKEGIKLYEGNVLDLASVYSVVSEVKPDKVFHLAAQSFVPYSWQAPQQTLSTNILGTANVLESVKRFAPAAGVLIAGTSEEYGLVNKDELPIKETNELRPLSPYGISKVAADFLGWEYFKSYGLKVVRTRAFNHTGPRRGKEFVVSAFIRQALDLEKGIVESMKVGNLDAIRDFTDVRDVVRAYWLALEIGVPGEVYNICSGEGQRISGVLSRVMLVVFGKTAIKVDMDESKMRPADVPVLIGDCSKFKKATNWKPEIHFSTTVDDAVDYWRKNG